jgi:hypothetical protein
VATESGLRWRGAWGDWLNLPWNTITDFYDEVRIDTIYTKPVRCPTIVTDLVTLRVSPDCIGLDDLRQVVGEQATAARVTEWEPLGVRRVDDWPKTFRYWDKAVPRKIVVGTTFAAAFLAMVGYAFVRLITWYASVSSVSETRGVMIAMSLGYLTFLFLAISKAGQNLRIWKQRGESFTVTPETLSYADSATGEILEASWREVSDYFYHVHGRGFKDDGFTVVLSGADEKQITWKRDLIQFDLLLAIVQRYAPKPAFMTGENAGWRNKSVHEKTGGSDPATWQGGAVGMGERVFRNRSLLNRVMLGFCTCVLLIFPFAAIQEWYRLGHGQFWGPIQVMGVIMPPVLWGWICYFRTRVETDDMGITHHTPLGKRFLPWFAIADYTDLRSKNNVEGDPIIVTGRDGKRMFFWSTLNGYEELRGEIERFAPPPKTGWKTVPSSRQ